MIKNCFGRFIYYLFAINIKWLRHRYIFFHFYFGTWDTIHQWNIYQPKIRTLAKTIDFLSIDVIRYDTIRSDVMRCVKSGYCHYRMFVWNINTSPSKRFQRITKRTMFQHSCLLYLMNISINFSNFNSINAQWREHTSC